MPDYPPHGLHKPTTVLEPFNVQHNQPNLGIISKVIHAFWEVNVAGITQINSLANQAKPWEAYEHNARLANEPYRQGLQVQLYEGAAKLLGIEIESEEEENQAAGQESLESEEEQ